VLIKETGLESALSLGDTAAPAFAPLGGNRSRGHWEEWSGAGKPLAKCRSLGLGFSIMVAYGPASWKPGDVTLNTSRGDNP